MAVWHMRFTVYFCFLVLASCSRGESAAPPITKNGEDSAGQVRNNIAKDVDGFVSALARLGYSGAVLLELNDTIVLQRGFGGLTEKARCRHKQLRFSTLGQSRRSLHSLAALKLIEDRKLTLESNIGEIFRDVPPDKRPITIRQLINHTSGLETYHDQDDPVQSRQQALRLIMNQKLRWSPGADYGYSNSGYTLLAMAIEHVTGLEFQAAARSLVLAPAAMKSTGWEGDKRAPPKVVAHGYFKNQDAGQPATDGLASYAILGAGGMYSTVADLQKLSRALRNREIIKECQVGH